MTLPASWHSDWSGLKAVVLGLGKSGFSVVDTLSELGVQCIAVGESADAKLIELTELVGSKFIPREDAGVLEDLGFTPDFAVISPGFAPSHPLVEAVAARGILALTDIDLAWRLRDKVISNQKWLAVTGTNGKTTTVELTAHLLQSAGLSAIGCGNIGSPVLDAVRDPVGYEFLVVELSSFQLHYLGEISPLASAFLNFADDHLDWHGSEAAYLSAKSKVYQRSQAAVIFNEQDEKTLVAAQAAEVLEGCRGIGFSLYSPQPSSIGYVEDILVDRAFLSERASQALEIATLEDLQCIAPISDQLRANVAAATALARAAGVLPAAIREGIRSFQLSPHRNQLVSSISGVQYVNDSKATNAHAAQASLASYDSVVWIVGGLFKGVDPSDLIAEHADRLRAAILIGKDTTELAARFAELAPQVALRVISGGNVMQQAVEQASALAQPGDTVLLAPAAASMDQFRDYQDRGNQFIAAVRRLG